MAAAKKSTQKSGTSAASGATVTSESKGNTQTGARIRTAYVEYVLTQGQRPASVYKFCLDLGIKEEAFYSHYGSFDGLEKQIWKGFIDKTITRLRADEAFAEFSTREKILAFYYTLLEELKNNRSYVLYQLEHSRKLELIPDYIKGFKTEFETFFETLLNEGKGNGEIATRPLLDKRYPQLFWMHLGFILIFWKEDDSPGFEKTDAAVEKSVNLAFDLIGKGAVDSAMDFAKFLYQNKK